jgi:hypothetical protein
MREMKSRRILFAFMFVLSIAIVSGGCGGFNEPGERITFADLVGDWVVESGTGTAVEYVDNVEVGRYNLNAIPLSGSLNIYVVSPDTSDSRAEAMGSINFLISIKSEDGQVTAYRRDETFYGIFERKDLNAFRMVGSATGSGQVPQLTITIHSLLPDSATVEESGTYYTSPSDGRRVDIVNGTYKVN